MSARKVLAIAAWALLLAPLGALGDEIAERETIQRRVADLFIAEQFQELDRIADEYLRTKARTSSGVWKSSLYHAALISVFNSRNKDEQFWTGMELRARKWVDAHPRSATARLARAQVLVMRAWSIRGGGYASTVRPQDWKPFHEYVQKARDYLEANKELASKDPNWYVMMAGIAKNQSWPDEEFSALVDEGLRREPLFYQLYFSAMDYYTPKWGGSAAAIEEFAQDALKRTLTFEGYGMYARIYWAASQYQFDFGLFKESSVSWELMKRGIDDVLRIYPDGWNIQNFAKFACMAGDKRKLAQLLARMEGDPIPQAWGQPTIYPQCKSWAAAPDIPAAAR